MFGWLVVVSESMILMDSTRHLMKTLREITIDRSPIVTDDEAILDRRLYIDR